MGKKFDRLGGIPFKKETKHKISIEQNEYDRGLWSWTVETPTGMTYSGTHSCYSEQDAKETAERFIAQGCPYTPKPDPVRYSYEV